MVYCFVYSILGTSCLIRSAFVSSRLISTTNSSAEAKSLILGVFPFISFAFLHCAAVFQTKPYLKYPLHLSLISDVLFKWLIGTICGIETPPLYDLIVPCVQWSSFTNYGKVAFLWFRRFYVYPWISSNPPPVCGMIMERPTGPLSLHRCYWTERNLQNGYSMLREMRLRIPHTIAH